MKHTEIETKQDLANYLRCDIKFLEKAIDEEFFVRDIKYLNSSDALIAIPSTEVTVCKSYIKKKGKKEGFRIVHQAWSYQLESSLKILNNDLNNIYEPYDFIHGFVKGKSIKTNANSHLAKKMILSVDIKNYFESISREMIISNLNKIGFSHDVSSWIASITTINGALVQGFCTSPTIANIVTHDLDEKLKQFCGDTIEYTRYADDLYFSSETSELSLKEITEIIENFGFKLNEKKTKFMKRGQHQFVTGLTTFDHKTARISKNRKRNIRLEIYYINKLGYKTHIINKLRRSGINIKEPDFKYRVLVEIDKTRDKLYGWLHFINSIEPDFSAKYYLKLKKAKQ
ncbi:hypothetical protein AAFH68_37350 [Flavobacterium sp. CGRL1]